MAFYYELFEDNNNENDRRREECEYRIQKVQNLLKRSRAKQWSVVSVEFGDQLFKDKNFNYYSMDKAYSIKDIKKVKGLNYGSYEPSYFHHAIILTPFDFIKVNRIKTLTVIPIQTKFRPNSYKLTAKFNRFLEYDSYALLDSLTTIGVERIDIDKSLNLGSSRELSQINPMDVTSLKTSLKNILGL